MPVFKTGAFVHSANPPFIENDLGILGPSGSYQQLERYIQPESRHWPIWPDLYQGPRYVHIGIKNGHHRSFNNLGQSILQCLDFFLVN
jgi:hypothetical protein